MFAREGGKQRDKQGGKEGKAGRQGGKEGKAGRQKGKEGGREGWRNRKIG